MKLAIILPFILSLPFAVAFSSRTTVGGTGKKEEDMTNGHHRHLQETELSTTNDDITIPTTINTLPLKCKKTDSKLQLQLETANGDIIPFFCA